MWFTSISHPKWPFKWVASYTSSSSDPRTVENKFDVKTLIYRACPHFVLTKLVFVCAPKGTNAGQSYCCLWLLRVQCLFLGVLHLDRFKRAMVTEGTQPSRGAGVHAGICNDLLNLLQLLAVRSIAVSFSQCENIYLYTLTSAFPASFEHRWQW